MVKIKKRLGDLLVEEEIITEKELLSALAHQKVIHKKLGETLIEMKLISKEMLFGILGEQMGIPYIELSDTEIEKEAILSLKREIAEKFNTLPIKKSGGILYVAMDDPLDIFAIDAIEEASGMEISQSISTKSEIQSAIEKYYSPVFLKGEGEDTSNNSEGDISAIEEVDNILSNAIAEGASDIHIEGEAKLVRIRFRIDGILHEVRTYKPEVLAAIVSRVKVMAKLDITEKRIPQDGRIELKKVDLRVSTLPTVHGEKIVIRILDKSNVKVSLNSLGFQGKLYDDLKGLITRPNGIFFVTGPTGSGKTSTLYASVNEINSLEKNIMTLEDPVEYQLEIINQVQVNPGAGMTFAKGLRAALRQDPDIIMIGEIRDLETAEIAIEAAMTGHLVFSTLHTNSAVGTVTRLLDMGVKPFLLSSTLSGVLGQRLIRRLCPKCKKKEVVKGDYLSDFRADPEKEYIIYKAVGCSHCRETGYTGRTALVELLLIDSEMRAMINKNCSVQELKKEANQKGMKTMKMQGYEKILEGITTVEEVLRVAQDDI